MNLLVPAALGFLMTLPVITLLYFLKLRRVRRVVPSTLLWTRAVRETRANTPFQRLRSNVLLLLQLLLAAALALALARPYVAGLGRLAPRRVVVIDTSASMGAVDGGGTSRFERARATAHGLAGGGDDSVETMIVAAGQRPSVALGFSADRRRVENALASLRPTEAPADLDRALALALAITEKDDSRDVVVITDGVAPLRSELLSSAGGVRVARVGGGDRNVAITSFDAVSRPGSEVDWEVFVGVTNFGPAPVSVRVLLSVQDRVLDARSLEVGPGATEGAVMPLAARGGAVVGATIEGEDALAGDDHAVGVLPTRQRMRVAVVSASGRVDPWLDRALRPLGVEPEPLAAGAHLEPAAYDLVIFDGVTPASVPAGAYLFWNPKGAVAHAGETFLESGAVVEGPVILDWERRSGLLRYVTFSDVHVRQGRTLAVPQGGRVLCEIEAGPVVVEGALGAVRFAAIGFDYRSSDLPYRAAFPILLSNAIATLPVVGERARPLSYPTGHAIVLDLPPDSSEEVTVVDPLGRRVPCRVAAGRYLFDGATRVGLYRVEDGGVVKSAFGASLLSPAESSLAPTAPPPDASGGAGKSGGAAAVKRELYPWLLALALALLTVEWLVYHRRAFA